MAQHGKDPALQYQHPVLDNGLVPRLAGHGGQDYDTVVGSHIGIGGIELRVVEAGFRHAALEVVRQQEYFIVTTLTRDQKAADARIPGLLAKEIAKNILKDNALW